MNLQLYVSSDSEPDENVVRDKSAADDDGFKANDLMNVEGNNAVFGSDDKQNKGVIQGDIEVVKGEKEEVGVFQAGNLNDGFQGNREVTFFDKQGVKQAPITLKEDSFDSKAIPQVGSEDA